MGQSVKLKIAGKEYKMGSDEVMSMASALNTPPSTPPVSPRAKRRM